MQPSFPNEQPMTMMEVTHPRQLGPRAPLPHSGWMNILVRVGLGSPCEGGLTGSSHHV